MPQDFEELARAAKSAKVDADGLAAALRRNLQGEVRFDNGSRALYATDASRCPLAWWSLEMLTM